MGLFGLGSFGEGFVKGFATEANEALKNDIERINTRVDDLAKIKFDRALKDQDERKKELREAEEVLREAGAVFGTDDPYAADYAAGLLKQSGSISAFRQEIAKLRDAKDNQVPLAQFIARASVDSPSGTYMDYANAYVNSRRTLPDVKVPDSASTAGNLIGSIFGKDKVDISGRVESQVGDQMAAAGITPSTAQKTSVFLAPDISYDREGVNLYQMSPSERITYWQQEEVRPGNSEERKVEIREGLERNFKAAETDSNLETALSSLTMQRDRIKGNTPEDVAARDAVVARMTPLLRQKEINAAEPQGQKAVLLVKAAHLEADGKMDEARELRRKADTLTGTTLDQLLQFKTEDAERAFALFISSNGQEGIDPNSEEGQALIQNNVLFKNSIEGIQGATALDGADLESASKLISNEFDRQIESSLIDYPELFQKDALGRLVIIPGLEDANLAQAQEIERDTRTDIIDNLIANTTNEKEKAALQIKRNEYEAKGMVNPKPVLDAEGNVVLEPLVIGDITVNADTVSAFAESAGVDVNTATASITTMITKHNPNNMEDATNPIYVDGALADKEQATAVIDAMEDTGIYSPEWIAAARKGKGAKTPETTISIDENVTKAADAISSLSMATGDRFKENAIMENVGVSREEAKELLVSANAELKRRKEQRLKDTPTEELNVRELLANVRSASNEEEYAEAVAAYAKKSGRKEDYVRRMNPFKGQKKAKGGLMSRGY